MSSFGNDIRRISKYAELKRLINEARSSADQPPKDPIYGRRSIVYASASAIGGAVAGASGGGGGSPPDGPGPVPGPVPTDPTQPVPTDAGDSNNGPDSGDLPNGNNNGSDGWFDAESILNNTADQYGKNPPRSGETINSITGLQNRDEDRDIITHLQDAALSFIPPENWDGPFSPGDDETFQFGFYWDYAGYLSATPAAALYAGLAAGAFPGATASGGTVTGYDINGDPNQYTYHVVFEPGTEADVNVVRQGDGSDCSGSQGSTVCPATAPVALSWTDLLVTQLAWVTPLTGGISPLFYAQMGKFIANKYDVNVPSEFLPNGLSILDLKSKQGNDIRITPTAQGGWAMYFSDPGNSYLPMGAVTDNSVYLIDNSRKAQGFITPNALANMHPVFVPQT